MDILKTYGLKQEFINPKHYVHGDGNLKTNVLQPDGQWDAFLPEVEIQHRAGLDTQGCTVYATLNCIEILHKRVFGFERNYSERFTGILAETTQTGNSMHKVAETIRKKGAVLEERLPFDDTITTWEHYYDPRSVTDEMLAHGRSWKSTFEFGHKWVFNPKDHSNIRERMIDALKKSPLTVSVGAWDQKGEYYIKRRPDNHLTTCYGYEYEQYWKIFDSYDNTHKKLVWDYDFGKCKKYNFGKKKSRFWGWLF